MCFLFLLYFTFVKVGRLGLFLPELRPAVALRRLLGLRLVSNAQRGNGIGGKGSSNETRVLRTMPSREKQGF